MNKDVVEVSSCGDCPFMKFHNYSDGGYSDCSHPKIRDESKNFISDEEEILNQCPLQYDSITIKLKIDNNG